MPITRVFLDWNRPALSAAVEYLIDQFTSRDTVDLDNVVIVVPGGRAKRRLLEILIEQIDQQRGTLIPPEIETVGKLPERLYMAKKSFANDLTQRLAWAKALHNTDRDLARQVIAQLPPQDDAMAWLALGSVLLQQHTTLAADALDFSKLTEQTAQLDENEESRRWKILRAVQESYLHTLDELDLWDKQTARLFAIEQGECHTTKQIILAGTVDLNRAMRQMLDQVSQRVTALVFAPPEMAGRFDGHGCLVPDQWQDAPVPLADDQVHVVDDPPDQADAVVRCIAGYQGQYRADQITIGFPDERLVAELQRQLDECNLPSRWGPGKPISQTAPYRLFEAVANYLERGQFAELAALARHPDMTEWLSRQGVERGWLTELDEYHNEHLPWRLTGHWLGPERLCQRIGRAYQAIEQLVDPLQGKERRLSEWTGPLRQLLLKVYGQESFDRHDLSLKACEEIQTALVEHDVIPESLAPQVTAARAIRWSLEQVQTALVSPPADKDAIELVGWLELPLDDAPALVVTSFNEGHVPKSINSDLFLPNSLRTELGLEDNARRWARDAYALSVLLASREKLTLIVGRRDIEGEPLTPSRLLFATDRETIARRALKFFGPASRREARPPLAGGLTTVRETSRFCVPRPQPLVQPITSLRVTHFRAYLACPYRFYLEHVLGLTALDDSAEELDGGAFGELAHEVLRQFGSGPARDSTDPQQIQDVLSSTLDQCVSQMYGPEPRAALSIQFEQLRARLAVFAQRQAAWARDGWRIEHTEVPGPGKQASLIVDGQPFTLRGRIDRIDVNKDTAERVIFDYKSSDSAKTPRQVHQRQGEWVDLQLPLYRHLVRCLDIAGPVKLGYIVLPKDTSEVKYLLADWTEDELSEADEAAREVVRRIRREEFWPPMDPPPPFSEPLAPICQDGVFDKQLAEDGKEEPV